MWHVGYAQVLLPQTSCAREPLPLVSRGECLQQQLPIVMDGSHFLMDLTQVLKVRACSGRGTQGVYSATILCRGFPTIHRVVQHRLYDEWVHAGGGVSHGA